MDALSHFPDIRRRLEPSTAATMQSDQDRRSPAEGTDTCKTCGHVVIAPSTSTHLPSGKIINQWRCSACGNTWDTFVESRLEAEMPKRVSAAISS